MIKYYKALPSINSRSMVCLITSLIWQAVSSGQELQLFEETETSSRVEEIPRSSQVRRDSDGNIISGPEFVLVGTTRIGGDFFVVLEDNMATEHHMGFHFGGVCARDGSGVTSRK